MENIKEEPASYDSFYDEENDYLINLSGKQIANPNISVLNEQALNQLAAKTPLTAKTPLSTRISRQNSKTYEDDQQTPELKLGKRRHPDTLMLRTPTNPSEVGVHFYLAEIKRLQGKEENLISQRDRLKEECDELKGQVSLLEHQFKETQCQIAEFQAQLNKERQLRMALEERINNEK